MPEQPAPVPNDSTPIVDLVIADLIARKALGTERYGVALQSFNGRDAHRDGYEEAADLLIYLRQARAERETLQPLLDELVRAAQTVVSLVDDMPRLAVMEQTVDLAEVLIEAGGRLRGALGRYTWAYSRTGLSPLPDANESYIHRAAR